mmetsp:Transcript_12552/g.23455  ORF Transcript_12552/g.23455 Transcript_12552/m.23455 type:complete len:298 (-) Transcript_12552:137-1030(-)
MKSKENQSATTTPTASTAYAQVGDVANTFVLSASVLYAAVVIFFTQPGKSGVLDVEWKKDGFCVQNKDVPFLSSFDTCLYVDILLSIVLGGMYYAWKDKPGMASSSEIVPMVILGTLGHGLAHGAMAVKLRDGTYGTDSTTMEGDEIPPLWQLLLFCALFWFPLLKASMPKLSSYAVAALAWAVTYGPVLAGGLKKELGFPYTQTVLSVAFHISQLMLSTEEKQRREYMTLPITAMLPVLTAWNEALFCTAYFRSAGGHVLYDASIVISFIVFYVDSYRANVMVSATSPVGSKQKTT